MIRFLSLIIFALLNTSLVLSSPADVDSTESSIDFIRLEATHSSRVVHFKWEVNAESKGAYFVIEKSIDNILWRTVSETKSIKNHNDVHTYMVSKINLAEGEHEFFRIKRVDQLGKQTVLDMVEINQPVLTSLKMIPNSRARKYQYILTYHSLTSSKGTMRVLNTDGDLIYDKSITVKEGYNRLTLDAKNYDVDSYIVVVRDANGHRLTQYFTR